jgi:hypothetical protein
MADIYAMTDTWNNGGTTFSAIKMDVTNTASAAGSMLLNLCIGGAKYFCFDINRSLYIYNTFTDTSNYERIRFGWSSNIAALYVEKAGTGIDRDLQVIATNLYLQVTSEIKLGSTSAFYWVFGVGLQSLYPAVDVSYDFGTTSFRVRTIHAQKLAIVDGITAPGTVTGHAVIYVDTADGDLKVKFGDGVTKVLAADT